MITEEEREKRRQRKERRTRKTEREFKKSLIEPPVDKMIREPEVKKGIWDALIQRGRDLHSGELTETANRSCAIGRGIGHE